MHTEYVKLSKEEKNQGYENLLRSQLELINSIRNFNNYKELRNRELSLKISLKSKIGEALGEIEKFDSLLPKTNFLEEVRAKKKERENKMVGKVEVNPLTNEINVIEQKLFRLRGGI